MKRTSLILFFAFVFASCTKSNVQTSEIGVLNVPITAIPDLELKYGDDINGNKVVDNVFDRLVSLDERLAPVPELSTSWRVISDRNEIEFEIGSEKRFHDGSLVTSLDILNSFVRSAKNKGKFTSQLEAFEDCMERKSCSGFKILSPTRFVLKLKNKNFELLMKNLASAEASVMKKVNGRYIGTGPYKITEINNDKIVTERFDAQAQFEKIVYKKIKPENQLKIFLSGGIDTISNLDSEVSKALLSNSSYIQKLAGTYTLVFQCARGIFKNRENRLAVANAINIDELQKKFEGEGIPAGGMIPSGYVGYTSKRHPFNVKKAREIISKNTKKTERKVILGIRETSKDSQILDKYLIDAFKNIGLTLEIKSMPFDAMLRDIRLRKVDMILKGEAPTNFDPSTSFVVYANGLSQRLQGYQNKNLSHLFLKYQNKTEKGEQIEILNKMEAAFFKDAPAIPLFYPVFTTWYRPGLHIKNEGGLSIKFWDFSYRDVRRTSMVRN
ncbi:MAG: ABC-type dipeptide transport system, periplasmic component [Bacteriovoracaceae bacterium]|nr:ABC-type dipeptide transport system, periplasmic component [Bacteriovoracaceae bacterium]